MVDKEWTIASSSSDVSEDYERGTSNVYYAFISSYETDKDVVNPFEGHWHCNPLPSPRTVGKTHNSEGGHKRWAVYSKTSTYHLVVNTTLWRLSSVVTSLLNDRPHQRPYHSVRTGWLQTKMNATNIVRETTIEHKTFCTSQSLECGTTNYSLSILLINTTEHLERERKSYSFLCHLHPNTIVHRGQQQNSGERSLQLRCSICPIAWERFDHSTATSYQRMQMYIS